MVILVEVVLSSMLSPGFFFVARENELQRWCIDKFEAEDSMGGKHKQEVTQRVSLVLEHFNQHVSFVNTYMYSREHAN